MDNDNKIKTEKPLSSPSGLGIYGWKDLWKRWVFESGVKNSIEAIKLTVTVVTTEGVSGIKRVLRRVIYRMRLTE